MAGPSLEKSPQANEPEGGVPRAQSVTVEGPATTELVQKNEQEPASSEGSTAGFDIEAKKAEAHSLSLAVSDEAIPSQLRNSNPELREAILDLRAARTWFDGAVRWLEEHPDASPEERQKKEEVIKVKLAEMQAAHARADTVKNSVPSPSAVAETSSLKGKDAEVSPQSSSVVIQAPAQTSRQMGLKQKSPLKGIDGKPIRAPYREPGPIIRLDDLEKADAVRESIRLGGSEDRRPVRLPGEVELRVDSDFSPVDKAQEREIANESRRTLRGLIARGRDILFPSKPVSARAEPSIESATVEHSPVPSEQIGAPSATGDAETSSTEVYGPPAPRVQAENPPAPEGKDRHGKFETLSKHLATRSLAIGKEAGLKAGKEGLSFINTIGEWYDKQHWAAKLAVTASLGVGAVLTAPLSAPIAGVLTGVLTGQRFLAGLGMYTKFRDFGLNAESISKDGNRWGITRQAAQMFTGSGETERKVLAGVFAAMYGALGAEFAREGVSGASKLLWGDAVQNWFKDIWSGNGKTTESSSVTPSSIMPDPTLSTLGTPEPPIDLIGKTLPIPPSEIPPAESAGPATPEDTSSKPEASPVQAAPEISTPPTTAPEAEMPVAHKELYASVTAEKGKGFIDMVTRMKDELARLQLDPSEAPKGSDLERLLSAEGNAVKGLAHKLAIEHGFMDNRGVTLRGVKLDSMLSFDEKGMLTVDKAINTPAQTVGPSASELEAKLKTQMDAAALNTEEFERGERLARPSPVDEAGFLGMSQAEIPASSQLPPQPEPQDVKTIPEPKPANENMPTAPAGEKPYVATEPPTRLEPPPGRAPAPESSESSATTPSDRSKGFTMPSYETPFKNIHNLTINPLEAKVYQHENGALMSYGKDFNDRLEAAKEYVRTNRGASVFVQAEEPVFVDGKWQPWVFEVRSGGFFQEPKVLKPEQPDASHFGYIDPNTFVGEVSKKKLAA